MPSTLTRWDPMTEIANMRSVVDRLFGENPRLPFRNAGEELGARPLSLDVYETAEAFVVKASVPGVDPKEIDIHVEDDVLTIKGAFAHNEEVRDEQYLRREIRSGSFERALRLPPTVDAEQAHCTFEHGVLSLELPKKPEARSRSIKITPQGVIEGGQEAQ